MGSAQCKCVFNCVMFEIQETGSLVLSHYGAAADSMLFSLPAGIRDDSVKCPRSFTRWLVVYGNC